MTNETRKTTGSRPPPSFALGAAAAIAALVYFGVIAADLSWPPRQISFPLGRSYFDWAGGHTIFSPRSSAAAALLVLAYIISSAAAGYRLFFRGALPADCPKKYGLLLGPLAFIPGYFVSVAVNRLVTLALPGFLAQPLLGAAYALLFALACRSVLRGSPRAWTALAAAAVYAFYLVDGLQKGSSHIMGDGAAYFLDLIASGGIFAPAARFPVFSQHYDEIMFLYPLHPLLRDGASLNLYLPFLMLYAAGKCAAALAVFFAVRALAGSALFAALLTVLVFQGNPFLSPVAGLLVFDSGSPVSFILHIGRVFGTLIPLLLPALLREEAFAAAPGAARLGALALLGAGLSASTPSNLYAPLAAAACWLLLKVRRSIPEVYAGGRLFAPALIGGLLFTAAAPLLVAGPPASFRTAGGFTLAFGILSLCAALFLAPAGRRPSPEHLRFTGLAALALCAGYAAGLLLLGNLFAPAVLGKLGVTKFLSRGLMNPLEGSLLDMFGWNRYYGVFPLKHVANPADYLRHFGLMYAALLLGLAASARRLLDEPARAGARDLLPAALGTFALAGVFLYEYTNGLVAGDQMYWLIWFKSRLAEPWYYGAILLCAAYAWRRGGRALRVFLACWAGGALAAEFIYNYTGGAAPQFLLNLKAAGRVLRLF